MSLEVTGHIMVREYRSEKYSSYGNAISSRRAPWLVCSCGHAKKLTDLVGLDYDERLTRLEHRLDAREGWQ